MTTRFILLRIFFNWVHKLIDNATLYLNTVQPVNTQEAIQPNISAPIESKKDISYNPIDFSHYRKLSHKEIEHIIHTKDEHFNAINTPDHSGTTIFYHIVNDGNMINLMAALLTAGKVNLKQVGDAKTQKTHLQLITDNYRSWGGIEYTRPLTIGLVVALMQQFPEFQAGNEAQLISTLKNHFPAIFIQQNYSGVIKNQIPNIREGFKKGKQLLADRSAADTFALARFHVNGYLTPSSNQQALSSNQQRFFNIHGNSDKEFSDKNAEPSFKHLLPDW